MTIDAFPTARDYIEAVQTPAKVFTTPALREATFVVDPLLHVPRPGVGASAVVFRAKINGRDEALRFFTRPDASDRERYQKLSRHVGTANLTDCLAASSWQDDAIVVKGKKWPLVRMEWIDGRPLDKYTEALVERGDLAALGGLAELWRKMVKRLQDAEFAHGDLQHGNVFVDQSARLRLVDLDGCWVPSLEGQKPPSEHGHPNYQRPSPQWNRWMDTFPALVVYLSLRALAKDPAPWDDLYIEDNLLFKEGDFATPEATDVWRHLRTIRDADVAMLADRLKSCCDPRWPATVPLEALLGTVPAPRRPPVREWWKETAASVPAAPSMAPVAPAQAGGRLPPPPRKTPVPPPFVPGRPSAAWSSTPPPWRPPVPAPRPPGNWWEPAPAGRPQQPTAPHHHTRPQPVPTTPNLPKRSKAGANFLWALLLAVGSGAASAATGAGAAALIIALIVGVFAFILLSFFRS